MGTQSGARNDGPMTEINITPFTDVLLVLLIIFMILASLATPSGFQKQVELPHSCSGCNIDDFTRNIDVSISASGATTIDGVRVASSRLYDRMAEVVRYHTGRSGYSTHIALAADSAAPYGSIIKVLDAAREAGDDDVGLITE
jgi:biopolymer transport protein TolR